MTGKQSFFQNKENIQKMKAGATALKVAGGYMSYQNTVVNADAQIAAIDLSIGENRRRSAVQVRNLRRNARKTVASQKEQFAISGVKMEGSAMDVVSDTLFDLLQAEFENENQLAFAEQQQRVKQASLQSAKSAAKSQFYINSATTLLGSAGGGMK